MPLHRSAMAYCHAEAILVGEEEIMRKGRYH